MPRATSPPPSPPSASSSNKPLSPLTANFIPPSAAAKSVPKPPQASTIRISALSPNGTKPKAGTISMSRPKTRRMFQTTLKSAIPIRRQKSPSARLFPALPSKNLRTDSHSFPPKPLSCKATDTATPPQTKASSAPSETLRSKENCCSTSAKSDKAEPPPFTRKATRSAIRALSTAANATSKPPPRS